MSADFAPAYLQNPLLLGSLDQAAERLREACLEWQQAMMSTLPASLRYECSAAATELRARIKTLPHSHSAADTETAWDAIWDSIGTLSTQVGNAIYITIGKRSAADKSAAGYRTNAGLAQISAQLRDNHAQTERELLHNKTGRHAADPGDTVNMTMLIAAAADTFAAQETPDNWLYASLVNVSRRLKAVVENIFAMIRRRLAPPIRYSLSDKASASIAQLIPTRRPAGVYAHWRH